MIRILHVLPSVNIGAGMVSTVMNFYRIIDRNRIQFDFIYFIETPSNCISEIEQLGGKVYKMPLLGLSSLKKINDFFKQHKGEYRAIHCHPIFSPIIYAPFAKLHGIKHVIAHSHSAQFSEKQEHVLRNQILAFLGRLFVTEYMACSKDAARLFGKKNAEEAIIIHNAIDCERFKFSVSKRKKIRNELRVSDNTILIGHIGRFTEAKNHRFIVEVFCKYYEKNKDSILLLVGNGELRDTIEKMVDGFSAKNSIVFLDNREDVDSILCALDFFIFPSIFEGFGMSLLEAETSGVTCIATETLPKEVFVVNNIYKLGLNDSRIWVNTIMETQSSNIDCRVKNAEIVRNAGLDIHDVTEHLQNFYLEL